MDSRKPGEVCSQVRDGQYEAWRGVFTGKRWTVGSLERCVHR